MGADGGFALRLLSRGGFLDGRGPRQTLYAADSGSPLSDPLSAPLPSLAPQPPDPGPAPGNGNTFYVIQLADSGGGSLRQAILNANASPVLGSQG